MSRLTSGLNNNPNQKLLPETPGIALALGLCLLAAVSKKECAPNALILAARKIDTDFTPWGWHFVNVLHGADI